MRLPTGVTIARRFRADTPLSMLLTYVASQGYPTEEFKVLQSWPRRDVSTVLWMYLMHQMSRNGRIH